MVLFVADINLVGKLIYSWKKPTQNRDQMPCVYQYENQHVNIAVLWECYVGIEPLNYQSKKMIWARNYNASLKLRKTSLTVPRWFFFCGSFCWLRFMLVCNVLSCLFHIALWSPAGKGLTSWLSCLLCLSISQMCPGPHQN